MFYLLLVAHARKPILVIPGLMSTPLNGTVTNFSSSLWYCPKLDEVEVWVNDFLVIPPFYNCIFDAIQMEWSEEEQASVERPGSHLYHGPLGDVNAISYVDTLSYDMHIMPTYKYLIEAYVNVGYTKNVDLFGLPYDWRPGLVQKPAFWKTVTRFIEDKVNDSGEKMVLVGQSMGGYFIQYFLGNVTTSEWRAKYIACAILIAPSFGGSGLAYSILYTGMLPAPFAAVVGERRDVMGKMGGLHVHVPNEDILRHMVVYKDWTGKVVTGANAAALLKDPDILPKGGANILDQNTDFWKYAPTGTDVPVAIVHNSAISTVTGVEIFKNGTFGYLYGPGDGMVHTEAMLYACNTWNKTATVDCLDIEDSSIFGEHIATLYHQKVLDFMVNHTVNTEWYKQN